jgi:hypothetical protein
LQTKNMYDHDNLQLYVLFLAILDLIYKAS